MFILLSEVHEFFICDSPLNFTDFVQNEHRMHAKQTEHNEIGAQ